MARQRARHASSSVGGNANGINQNTNNNNSNNNNGAAQRTKRSTSAPAPVRETGGLCSRFIVEIKPGSKAYRYDVSIHLQYTNGRPIESTGRIFGQARRTLFREVNRKVLQALRRKADIQTATAYDNATTLFAASPLSLKEQHHFPRDQLDPWIRQQIGADFLGADVTLAPNSSAPVLALDHIMRQSDADQDPNKPLRMFLEIATSEWAVDSGNYTSLPGGKLFSNNPQRHIDTGGEGIIIRPGLKKGVSIVENDGHPSACVDIDVKFSPFFKMQPLINTAKTIHMNPVDRVQYEDISDTIADVEVQCAHNRKITFGVGAFSEEPLSQIPLNPDEPNKLLIDYYRDTYKINLKNPNWSGVKHDRSPGKIFPIELLDILPHQTVPLGKMTDQLSKQLHAKNNVRPSVRYSLMLSEAKNIRLFDMNNQSLAPFGVYVRLDSNDLSLEQYSKPGVSYKAHQTATVDSVTGTWRSGRSKYADTKPVNSWWAVYYPKDDEPLVKEFMNLLKQEADLRGVFLADSKYMKLCPYKPGELNIFENFEMMAKRKVCYVLYLDSNRDTVSHTLLKLAENMHGICTQHVTTEVVRNVVERRQRQTLENIVAKANVKFAGLNYHLTPANLSGPAAAALNLPNGELLVFGMDVAHPKQPSLADRRAMRRVGIRADSHFSIHPSVVGFCGNVTANPECFSGGFFYQRSRCEQVDSQELTAFVGAMLAALKRNRPSKCRPATVLILRDGVSEGQYEMVKHDEFPAIRAAFTAYDPEWRPKVALMIVTKRHLKRLYEQSTTAAAPATAENPQPFTLADERFARLGTDEMTGENLVVPHRAIQGTTKPIQTYTLINETPYSRDSLVKFAMSLAYHHQIVNLPTSLPQPIYQADDLATRGNNNYIQFRQSFVDRVPYRTEYLGVPNSTAAQRQIEVVDTAALNAILSPRDTPLLERRFV